MRNLWTKGLALALGWAIGAVGASAQETAPAAVIGKPVASIGKPVARSVTAEPAATISRPVAIARPAEGIAPASYSPLPGVVRGVSPDPLPARDYKLQMHSWRPANEPTGLLRTAGVPMPSGAPLPPPIISTMPTPLPGTAGPVSSGPITSSPVPLGVPGGIVASPGVGMPANPWDCECPGGCPTYAGAIDGCPPNSRFWLSAEYLLWRMRGDLTPPLVSAGPFTGAPTDSVLAPTGNGQVVYGGTGLGQGLHSGLRGTAGWWFSDEHLWGAEVSGFFLAETKDRFTAFSSGNPVLGRPILDQSPLRLDRTTMTLVPNEAFPGGQNVKLVASLNPLTPLAGSIDVQRRSSMWGYEANLRRGLWRGDSCMVDLIGGFRAVSLDESLAITEALSPMVANPFGITGIVIRDKFSTSNRFYGGQLGLVSELQIFERLSLGVNGKVALGTTRQQVTIDGSTSYLAGGTTFAAGPGGLLALPSNIGTYSRNRFTVVPELGLTLNYQWNSWLRVFGGYNYMYWSSVVRPGEQIDLNVNRLQQPQPVAPGVAAPIGGGPNLPAAAFRSNSFYAHGLTFGLELRY